MHYAGTLDTVLPTRCVSLCSSAASSSTKASRRRVSSIRRIKVIARSGDLATRTRAIIVSSFSESTRKTVPYLNEPTVIQIHPIDRLSPPSRFLFSSSFISPLSIRPAPLSLIRQLKRPSCTVSREKSSSSVINNLTTRTKVPATVAAMFP